MRKWTKILPFFVVEYIAKKYGEKWYDERTESYFTYPFKNVRFYFENKEEEE